MSDAPWMRVLPRNWRKIRLKNLVGSVSTGVWGEEPVDGQGIPCIRAADFDREHLRASLAQAPLRAVTGEQLRTCGLARGDLILEKSGGGSQQPVGAVVRFDADVDAVPSNFAARIRPASDVDSRFLCYLFAAAYGLGLTTRSIKQTTGIQNLDLGAYLAEQWAIPPLEQQTLIAEYLDREMARIDRIIAANTHIQELLTARRQSLLARRLPPATWVDVPGEAEPTQVERPPKWRVAPLKHVTAEFISGGTPNTEEARYWSSSEDPGVPWMTVGDLVEHGTTARSSRRLTPEGLADSGLRVGHAGTVLLAMYASVGKASVLGVSACWNQAILGIVPRGELLLPRYLCFWLEFIQSQLLSDVRSNTQDNINAEQVSNVKVAVPPIRDQRRILANLENDLSRLDRLSAKIRQEIMLLESLRQAVIVEEIMGSRQPDSVRNRTHHG